MPTGLLNCVFFHVKNVLPLSKIGHGSTDCVSRSIKDTVLCPIRELSLQNVGPVDSCHYNSLFFGYSLRMHTYTTSWLVFILDMKM